MNLLNNKDDFSKAIKNVQNKAYKIAYSMLKEKEDSMDAVCNAIESAYKNIHSLKNTDFFETWFIRIVINECHKELKRRKSVLSLSDKLKSETTYYEQSLNQIYASEILSELKEPEKSIVLFKYKFGYTLKEIADILDMPESTVKTKLYSTLKKLKKSFEYDREVLCNG